MNYLKGFDLKFNETLWPLLCAWVVAFLVFFFFLKLGLDSATFAAAFPVFGVLLPFMRVYKIPKTAILISFIIGYGVFNQNFSFSVLGQGIVGALETIILYMIIEISSERKYSFLIHRSIVALVAAVFGLCYGIFFFVSTTIFTSDFYYSIAGMGIIHVVSAIVVAPFIRENLLAFKEKSWLRLYGIPLDVLLLMSAVSALFFFAQVGIQYIFLVMLSYGYFAFRCRKEQLFVINFFFTIVIAVISDELWGPFVGLTAVQTMFSGGLTITAIVMISFAFYEVKEVNLHRKAFLFFVAIIGIFSGISYAVNSQELRNYFKHLDSLIVSIEDRHSARMDNSRILSKALRGFWVGSSNIQDDEWIRFGQTLELSEEKSGVHAAGFFSESVSRGQLEFTLDKYFTINSADRRPEFKTSVSDSSYSFLNHLHDGECFFIIENLGTRHGKKFYSFVAIEFKKFFGSFDDSVKGQIVFDVSLVQTGEERFGYVFQKDASVVLSANKLETYRRQEIGDQEFLLHYYLTQQFDSGAFLIFWRTSLLFTLVCILFGKVLIETMKSKELLQSQAEDLTLKLLQSSRQAALGEMASGIAHEVNNPLTIISLTSQKLLTLSKKGLLSLNQVEPDLEKLVKTAERISKIIRGLKAMGRNAEADPKVEVSLSQIINDSLEVCLERFRHNSVELEVNLPSRRMVMGRSAQLSQVIVNLLNNSFDAIVEQRKADETLWVRVDCIDLKDRIEVSVTDSGSGIPASVREKMFQPFFTTKGVGKGTGIGLEISRRIVADHEGELRYDETSKNTRFVFSLPVIEAKPNEQSKKAV